jgi:hypothetical protein
LIENSLYNYDIPLLSIESYFEPRHFDEGKRKPKGIGKPPEASSWRLLEFSPLITNPLPKVRGKVVRWVVDDG